jgi:hypothetical protein
MLSGVQLDFQQESSLLLELPLFLLQREQLVDQLPYKVWEFRELLTSKPAVTAI